MEIPKKFLLPGGIKHLRVQQNKTGNWMIWLNANGDFTLGSFIELNNNGTIERITWHPDGSESRFLICGEKDGTINM